VQAPKYTTDWAYLLQHLADMPDVMAIEPNFVVSSVFSAEAVAARHQQRQQPAVPAAPAGTAAAEAEEDSTAVASVTAEAAVAAVEDPTGVVPQVLQPTFAVGSMPAAGAQAALALSAKRPADSSAAVVAAEGTDAGDSEGLSTQATAAAAAAAAVAADWLPRQAGGGRKLKAW
jgi:hypothetical protein